MRQSTWMVRALRAVLLAGLLISAGGCVAAGAAVGAKFATGNAKGPIEASPEQTRDAALAVLEDSGFTIVKNRVDPDGEIEIEGENADGRKARLKIDPVDDVSALSVRLGLLGDKDEARVYFDRIEKRAEQ